MGHGKPFEIKPYENEMFKTYNGYNVHHPESHRSVEKES